MAEAGTKAVVRRAAALDRRSTPLAEEISATRLAAAGALGSPPAPKVVVGSGGEVGLREGEAVKTAKPAARLVAAVVGVREVAAAREAAAAAWAAARVAVATVARI